MKDMKIARTETVDKIVRNYHADGVLVSQYPEFLAERDLPPILQLQADPFPTELQYVPDDKEIAEQGFIEQDASAPIKEQCEENARLMREIAKLKGEVIAKNDLLIKTNERVAVLLETVHMFQGKFDNLSDKFKEQNISYAKLYEECMKNQGAVVDLMKCINDLRA